jgi:Homeodomain-like domain-containing protein
MMSGVSADRKLRDRGIVEARQRGESPAAIAKRFDVSERTVRRLIEQARRAPVDLDELDPDVALREAVAVHREAIEQLGRLGRRGNNASAKVGAAAARARASRDLIQLLAWGGRLPDRPATWRVMLDLKQLGRDVTVLLAAIKQGAIEREAVEQFFVQRVPKANRLPAVPQEEIDKLVRRLAAPRVAA